LATLERQLLAHRHHPLLIGSFSAGSNVTGALCVGIIIMQAHVR
jgi:hypothetical protein